MTYLLLETLNYKILSTPVSPKHLILSLYLGFLKKESKGVKNCHNKSFLHLNFNQEVSYPFWSNVFSPSKLCMSPNVKFTHKFAYMIFHMHMNGSE